MYNNCKVKIISSYLCKDFTDYENQINEFMNTHNVVDVKVSQSDVSYMAYIFYIGSC